MSSLDFGRLKITPFNAVLHPRRTGKCGLRDYGTAAWMGGDADCSHLAPPRGGTGEASKVQLQVKRKEFASGGQYTNECKKCGATRTDNQIGLEKTPELYVAKMVEVFREVKRVLRKDGTLWLNLGDSYMSGGGASRHHGYTDPKYKEGRKVTHFEPQAYPHDTIKPKDLIGIPWRVALALQADGWWLRQDIIWCLSGGTWLYARTQKGDMPIMLRDLARLDPKTVRLWTGQQWTQVLGWSKNKRTGEELEIVLRSGERIACTPHHYFPIEDYPDEKQARHLCVGMKLKSVLIPEPASPKDSLHINTDIAWFIGLYIAEGSRSGDTIQIAGHAKEELRWHRVKTIAEAYGCSATRKVWGNNMSIRVYGKVMNAMIDHFVSGRIAKDKCLSPFCWKYSNRFLRSLLDGYLSGDGHYDKKSNRWRLGFTRNYNLERDMRTLSARLGFHLILNPSTVRYKGTNRPTFRGEIRFERSGHFNEKNPNEIIEIRKSRCRETYDVGVEDEPHLFALASGVLTHNSKPNPMPESITDRCTKSHEYIFLLTKSAKYYYDADAIKEPSLSVEYDDRPAGIVRDRIYDYDSKQKVLRRRGGRSGFGSLNGKNNDVQYSHSNDTGKAWIPSETRNKRSVWTISTKPYSGAHFAAFPEEIPTICIKAGTKKGDVVLDPFAGSGTTLEVAKRLGRDYIGIELSEKYVKDLIEPRLADVNPLFS